MGNSESFSSYLVLMYMLIIDVKDILLLRRPYFDSQTDLLLSCRLSWSLVRRNGRRLSNRRWKWSESYRDLQVDVSIVFSVDSQRWSYWCESYSVVFYTKDLKYMMQKKLGYLSTQIDIDIFHFFNATMEDFSSYSSS